MLVANRARRAVLEGIEYGHPDPHLAGRLAQHLPQLASPQHADDRVGDAMHRLVAMPTSTTHQKKKKSNQVKILRRRQRMIQKSQRTRRPAGRNGPLPLGRRRRMHGGGGAQQR